MGKSIAIAVVCCLSTLVGVVGIGYASAFDHDHEAIVPGRYYTLSYAKDWFGCADKGDYVTAYEKKISAEISEHEKDACSAGRVSPACSQVQQFIAKRCAVLQKRSRFQVLRVDNNGMDFPITCVRSDDMEPAGCLWTSQAMLIKAK